MRKFTKNFLLIVIISYSVFLSCSTTESIKTIPITDNNISKQSCINNECHYKINKGKFTHAPAVEGKCNLCHISKSKEHPDYDNVNDFKAKAKENELCFSCHEKLYKSITYVTQTHFHSPLKQGKCTACHDPHTSKYKGLLKKYLHEKFFLKFKVEYFELCWECHNKDIVLEPVVEKITDFRNGNVNLHFKHVNRAPKKGNNCKRCHEPHSSAQPKLIKPFVPFDRTYLLMCTTNRFTKTDSGGNCETSCHKRKYYDRNNAVINK